MVFGAGTQKLIDDALAKTAAEYAAKNAAAQISADPRAAGFKGSDVGQAETLRFLQNKYDSPTSQLPAGSNVPFNYRTAQRGSMMRPAGSAMTAGKELAMTGRTADPRAAAVQLRELKKQYGDRFAQVPAGQVVPERYGDAAGVPVPKTLGLGDVDWEEVQRRIDAQNAAAAAETVVDPEIEVPVGGGDDPPPTFDPAIACALTGGTWANGVCIPAGVGAVTGGGVGDEYYRPADMEETIRDLFGERQATDLSQNIIDLISGRRTSLSNAEARRNEQIGEIARTLTGDIGALETDRTAQQQALIDAIAGRATGLTTGSEDRIAAARQALGPQVTDEFEQAAALASGLASSQAASSQDAMSRLAQIANMAAAERQAAPAQLAAESRLALGDEAFQVLQGLNAEESERLLAEQLRQEQFNQARDEDMINALLGDEMRREQFLVDEGIRLQGQDYQAGQAALDREFREGESALDRALRVSEAELDRDQRDTFERTRRFEDARDYKFRKEAYDAEIAAAKTEEEATRLADNAAAEAEAAGSLAAAEFYGLGGGNPEMGKILWDQMSASERKAVRDQYIADRALYGQFGDEGTYESMVRRYGENQAPLIRLAQEAAGMNENDQEGFFAGLAETDALGQGKQMSTEDIALIKAYASEMGQLTTAREEAAAPYNQPNFGTEAAGIDAELAAERKDFARMATDAGPKVTTDPKTGGMGSKETDAVKQTGQGITFEKGGYGSRDNLMEPKTGKQAPIQMYEQNAAGVAITPDSWVNGRPIYIESYHDGIRYYYIGANGQKIRDNRGWFDRNFGGEWDWVPNYAPLNPEPVKQTKPKFEGETFADFLEYEGATGIGN